MKPSVRCSKAAEKHRGNQSIWTKRCSANTLWSAEKATWCNRALPELLNLNILGPQRRHRALLSVSNISVPALGNSYPGTCGLSWSNCILLLNSKTSSWSGICCYPSLGTAGAIKLDLGVVVGHSVCEKAFLEVVQLLPIEIYSNSASAESMGTCEMEILHHLLKMLFQKCKANKLEIACKPIHCRFRTDPCFLNMKLFSQQVPPSLLTLLGHKCYWSYADPA